MAESKNNKPKTEKTSASVTSTLPRLKQKNNSYLKDFSCNIPKLKSRFQGNKIILDEKQKLTRDKENSQINFEKLKFIEFDFSSDQKSSGDLLFPNSPKNYHGQIPVRYRHSLNALSMSPIATRSPSPVKKISPKDKVSNKVKVITLEQETKKKRNTDNSRSPSPLKKGGSNHLKSKSKTHSTSLTTESFTSSEKTGVKFQDKKRSINAKPNTKSKKLKDKNKELCKNSTVIKQTSQPNLPIKEKILPQGKISLDHLKSEVYSGDHTRLSFEKVQLCIEKSMDNLALKEKKRRYFVTYSSEDTRKKSESNVSLLKNVSSTSITTYSTDSEKRKLIQHSKSDIKSLSEHELSLTPSVKLDIEKGDMGSEDLEISDFLNENDDNYGSQKVIIPHDETNEYDTEVSTDGEMTIRDISISSPSLLETKNNDLNRENDLWKSREAELLSDVDYRQSVYHPAVSRRHKDDNEDVEFGGKNKSHEDHSSSKSKQSSEGRSHSSTGKNKSTSSSSKQMSSNRNKSKWICSLDKIEEKPMHNSIIPASSFYGLKKSRTKKEKVSGALLHFTLKVIRLLAIFNLWPGDNCHMLTSQSVRFAS